MNDVTNHVTHVLTLLLSEKKEEINEGVGSSTSSESVPKDYVVVVNNTEDGVLKLINR